jgi:excisionase family DNA binding protein
MINKRVEKRTSEKRVIPKRHRKMYAEAGGIMFYSSSPLAGNAEESDSKKVAPQQKPGFRMFSMEACQYLGCSMRHLYWLMRNKSFPFYVFEVGATPRYSFNSREVDDWLSKYRGKGKQLGLRKARLVNN